ncbi:hypothetical protein Pmani_019013 [Petrolisthes manimaculis]|uniref:Uncharacterized protein n=1 Tax=Petrolisthes manimaculis TaxID=1843537 RepID=A0AAE1PLP4_9EUCA|nr:hypothetical protein Pmani_019013 [Petrolisthes manimaculis]
MRDQTALLIPGVSLDFHWKGLEHASMGGLVLMVKIVKKYVVVHLEKNKAFNDGQHGFRTGRSCLSQLLEHYQTLLEYRKKDIIAHVIYTHFAKAFDKTDYNKWFNPANFGTWWSVLTASSNVSGTLSPFIAAYIIINHGWSASLVLAGLVSLLMAGVTLITLVDDPTRVNLPDPTLSTQTSTSTPKEKKAESKDQNTTTSNNNMTVKELVTSPFLWVVSGCYLAVFCTKTALADWAQIYLMEELGRTQLQASSFTSAMETGGFFGGILAGILTDRLASKIRVRGNIRLMVASGFMLVCAVAVHVLRSFLTIHTSQIVVSGVGMVLGASMFGPISIYGIVASESFPAHLSGTAHAIVALAANGT